MEIMAKGPQEFIDYAEKVVPWIDHLEYSEDDEWLELITFKSDTPQEIKDLFTRLEPKIPNVELKN